MRQLTVLCGHLTAVIGSLPNPNIPPMPWRPLHSLDRSLMSRLGRRRSRGADRALVGVSRAANYGRLWLMIAGALAALGGRSGRRAAVRGLIGLAIAATVANGPLKLLTGRRRPAAGARPTLIRMPRSTSFPSGHSASAFGFATGASAEAPALTPVLLPLAAAVAYSRVHAGVHYPSDVAVGILIGVGSGLLAGHWSVSRDKRS
jgi:undecaprenyl-diphosphatase